VLEAWPTFLVLKYPLPMKYLCLPLATSFKEKSIWDGIIEKMEQQLAGSKQLYSSERATLFKSTLSNLPTYYLSLFPISVGVANHIEKLQQDFFFGLELVRSLNSIMLVGLSFALTQPSTTPGPLPELEASPALFFIAHLKMGMV
jgi:hypothetical protein